jgi:hypothetical protein
MAESATIPRNAWEQISSLTPNEKLSVFVSLLHEVVELHGTRSTIPIEDAGGNFLGYFVPADVAKLLADKWLPTQSDDERRRIRAALDSPDDAIPFDAMLGQLNQTASPPVR